MKNIIFADINLPTKGEYGTVNNNAIPSQDLSSFSIKMKDYEDIKKLEYKKKSQIKEYLEGKIPENSSEKRENILTLNIIREINLFGKKQKQDNKEEYEKLDKIIRKLKNDPSYESKSKYEQILNYLYNITSISFQQCPFTSDSPDIQTIGQGALQGSDKLELYNYSSVWIFWVTDIIYNRYRRIFLFIFKIN
jgi:hypothetical protein